MSEFTNNSGGESGGGSLIHQATVTINDAAIKAWPTTPVQIVAAPGAGKIIIPTIITVVKSFITEYGAVAPEATIEFKWRKIGSSTSVGSPYFVEEVNGDVTSFLDDGTRRYMAWVFAFDLGLAVSKFYFTESSEIDNHNFSISASNSDVPFTGGNAANVAIVNVAHMIWNTTTGVFE